MLDDLARAGLTLTEALAVKVLAADSAHTCYVQAAVKSAAAVQAEGRALAEELRRRYGKQ